MAKVLVIEDDKLVSRMYQKAFDYEGLNVVVAGDGREGLQEARKEKPELIFLDVMMPNMNGIEVLEHLKADEGLKDVPVVMLTNLSGTQDAEVAKEKGAVDYLIKSEYKPKDIALKAKEYLGEKAGEVTKEKAEGKEEKKVEKEEVGDKGEVAEKEEEMVKDGGDETEKKETTGGEEAQKEEGAEGAEKEEVIEKETDTNEMSKESAVEEDGKKEVVLKKVENG